MISNLPDDCLLEIFQYLNEDALMQINRVDKRMCYLTQSLIMKIYSGRPGELRIVESEVGHAFHLRYPETQINYVYHIEKRDCISKSTSSCDSNATRVKFTGDRNPEYERMLIFNDDLVDSSKLIPSLLLSTLNKFIERHSFTRVSLKNIRIDSLFLSYFEENLLNVKFVGIIGAKVDNDCVGRLSLLILRRSWPFFYIRNSSTVLKGLNMERWYCAFSDNKTVSHVQQEILNRLNPSNCTKGYFVHNTRFEKLSFMVNASSFPTPLEIELACRNDTRMHIWAFDDNESADTINWEFHRISDFEFIANEGADLSIGIPSHLIRDKRNGKSISFAIIRVETYFILLSMI